MSRSRVGASVALMAVAFCVTACVTGPVRPRNAQDPRRYSEPAPTVAADWQTAREAAAVGEHEIAWPLLSRIVRESPDLVRAHLAYQDASMAIGGESEAEMRRYYRYELPESDSPVGPYVRARLADTSYARGQALQQILEGDRSFGWAWLSLGRVRRGQGQLQAAVDAFATAYVNDPGLHEAALERAQALADLGRLPEAALDYERYFEHVPDDYVAMREYASMLIYRLVRIDRALELLARLDAKFENDLDLRMHRAAALWRAFRPREALSNYLAVLDLDPRAARAALNIGLIYYDAMPQNDSDQERRQWWPKARAAFRYFLALGEAADGHEAFERSLAVPYRLGVIDELLGAAPTTPVTVDDLRLAGG
ncbi:MAG: tetratricopeptide repeat protein [bacterium]|nr:tetratricopeptide repeat protein [bacterium]